MIQNSDVRRRRLIALIYERGFRVGRFTLASGATSNFYVDVRMAATDPEGSALIGDLLIERIAALPEKTTSVGGMALGAVPVAMAVTARSWDAGFPLATFITRKDAKGHGTGRKIEGHIRDGDPIVIFDDTVTTGGSTIQAIEAVAETFPGVRIVSVMAVVDREEGGRGRIESLGYPFQALVTRSDLFDLYREKTGLEIPALD